MHTHKYCILTMVTILVDVSQVFHRKTKHRVLSAIDSGGFNFVPVSSIIDINVHSSSNFSILFKVLRCSHHYVLPTNKQQRVCDNAMTIKTVIALFKAEIIGCVYHPVSLTCPRWDPAQPDRSRKMRPDPPLPGYTLQPRCCVNHLSLAAPLPRYDSLWELPPQPSVGPSWSNSSLSPERSLNDRDKEITYIFRGTVICVNEMRSHDEDIEFYPGSCWQGQGLSWDSFHSHLLSQRDHRQRCPSLWRCCSFVPGVRHLKERRGDQMR